jgi:hypothetical protein
MAVHRLTIVISLSIIPWPLSFLSLVAALSHTNLAVAATYSALAAMEPKDPKTTVTKVVGEKGMKASFHKPCKAPPPKMKTE